MIMWFLSFDPHTYLPVYVKPKVYPQTEINLVNSVILLSTLELNLKEFYWQFFYSY